MKHINLTSIEGKVLNAAFANASALSPRYALGKKAGTAALKAFRKILPTSSVEWVATPIALLNKRCYISKF